MRLPIFAIWLGLVAVTFAEQAPLTRVSEVLAVPHDAILAGCPVHFKATVLYHKSGKNPDLFVRDESSAEALFVDTRACRSELKRGDVVEIEGVLGWDEFAPKVTARVLRVVGAADLPLPQPAPLAAIHTLRDGQYVALSGIVRNAFIDESLDPPRLLADLATPGGNIRLWVLAYQGLIPEKLIDAEVQVSGVVHYFRNGRIQPSGVRLLVSTAADLTVHQAAPADPFAIPPVPLSAVETYSPEGVRQHRIHVTGTVTHVAGKTLFLQAGRGGVRVFSDQLPILSEGDVVDAAGFSAMGERYGQIENAICRLREHGPAPQAVRPDAGKLDPAIFDGGLVEVEGIVRDRFRAEGSQVLLLQRERQFFQASMSESEVPSYFDKIALGSVVRATAIWESIREPGDVEGKGEGFRLLLRRPSDLVVLHQGPWWTVKRLALAVGLLVMVMAGGAAWMAYLRRRNIALEKRVEERGAQLARETQARRDAEVKFAAITAERNRLARDLHDTVEQMLTGAGVQLSLLTDLLPENEARAHKQVTFVREILREAKAEARRSIWDLQPHLLQEHDLVEALREMALQLTEGSIADFKISVTGTPRPLAMMAERQLLRIGQEAITNAVKHAAAACIQVEIDFRSPDVVTLRVSDNGCGFLAEQAGTTADGHFGLDGIRDRARRMGGLCEIRSEPGKGTSIAVQAVTAEAETP